MATFRGNPLCGCGCACFVLRLFPCFGTVATCSPLLSANPTTFPPLALHRISIDLVFATSGVESRTYLKVVSPGGALIYVSLPKEVTGAGFLLKNRTVGGSLIGSPSDMREMLAFAAEHDIKVCSGCFCRCLFCQVLTMCWIFVLVPDPHTTVMLCSGDVPSFASKSSPFRRLTTLLHESVPTRRGFGWWFGTIRRSCEGVFWFLCERYTHAVTAFEKKNAFAARKPLFALSRLVVADSRREKIERVEKSRHHRSEDDSLAVVDEATARSHFPQIQGFVVDGLPLRGCENKCQNGRETR
jgi:hypothetical protein